MSSSFTDRRFIIPAVLPLAVVALLGLLFVVSPIGAQTPTDRDVLVALYNATDGGNWRTGTNWLSQEPLGNWHGVTTNSNGRVTVLKLSSNRLNGEIPGELGSLTDLTTLWLNGNDLSGEMPNELGNLTSLTELLLDSNDLSGEIPGELSSLTSLEALYINQNSLTGALPQSLTGIGALDFFHFYLNDGL